ncbi:histidinol dehydrogenase [Prochlorococcus marinus]|uniref:histidinol dehydrogenase n=1 Tax=Prochlorococcus marinus TaxID=1219 RepID=UPI001ADC2CD8|nr:histidinol dehydrogenase [Prochlorococcus marinus]MBO8217966.1 histidinol dehydrogenase [Prochlorococcus marinus XMU1405]MBW3039302.1 histidinol dehydrogenase [Prochlorococcus marinus str. MU1405]MBW3046758.1 histidinol dehydrogenase [Prochlorococcus marinus str. MU1406]
MKIVNDKKEAIQELKRISNRTNSECNYKINAIVEEILQEVKTYGDLAVEKYTEKFDGFNPNPMQVSKSELKHAWDTIESNLKQSLEVAHRRIKKFHEQEIPSSFTIKGEHGDIVQRRWTPVKHAGIYIPGGRAAYPSTVLMNAIPAKVAGVQEISMVSPGNSEGKINKTVLAAAYLSGINKVFRIGGAQAIGALAFGTNQIDKVDVISGPGNIYVTTAKKQIYGSTGIDSLAGPSEILIIADETAHSKHIASDLLAQAEHDPLASSILLTTSTRQAKEVLEEIYKRLDDHPRKEICVQSINNWGLIVICENHESCIELSNNFAPEHLEIIALDSKKILGGIDNAGAIFLGKWTPEAVGDYLAGPNHTLPTSGNSRFSGSLGVETFMKNTSIIEFNEKSLKVNSIDIINLAKSEGLHSHANSVQIRFED